MEVTKKMEEKAVRQEVVMQVEVTPTREEVTLAPTEVNLLLPMNNFSLQPQTLHLCKDVINDCHVMLIIPGSWIYNECICQEKQAPHTLPTLVFAKFLSTDAKARFAI